MSVDLDTADGLDRAYFDGWMNRKLTVSVLRTPLTEILYTYLFIQFLQVPLHRDIDSGKIPNWVSSR